MQNVEEINKNIENKTVDKQAWQSLGFDELQTIEIIRGIENGVDVSVYCKEEFNAAQMKALRLGLEEKLDVSRFADAQYDYMQMEELKQAVRSGMNMDDICNPKFSHSVMREIRLASELNYDLTSMQSLVIQERY